MSVRETYDPAADSRDCYLLALRACREMAIREGQIFPATDEERRWAKEGPRPVPKLEVVRG